MKQFRITDDLYRRVRIVAAQEDNTLQDQVAILLEEALKARGEPDGS